jgi:hypothetical protein
MFFLFSSKLGCIGSLLVSAAATLLLLWVFGFIGGPKAW